MSFMSKLTKEFDNLKANLSDKHSSGGGEKHHYGRAYQPEDLLFALFFRHSYFRLAPKLPAEQEGVTDVSFCAQSNNAISPTRPTRTSNTRRRRRRVIPVARLPNISTNSPRLPNISTNRPRLNTRDTDRRLPTNSMEEAAATGPRRRHRLRPRCPTACLRCHPAG